MRGGDGGGGWEGGGVEGKTKSPQALSGLPPTALIVRWSVKLPRTAFCRLRGGEGPEQAVGHFFTRAPESSLHLLLNEQELATDFQSE